jgi:hypothetical protein
MSERTNEIINRLIDSRDRAVAAWGEVCIERDEWRDLCRRMRGLIADAVYRPDVPHLDGASDLVNEFDRKAGA